MLLPGRSCLEAYRCGVQVLAFPDDLEGVTLLATQWDLTPVFLQIQLSSQAFLPLKTI